MNRISKFFEDVEIAYPKFKQPKKRKRRKDPVYWVIERPLIQLLNKGKINNDEFVLMVRIENLCYYDENERLHPFFGSNKYLAEVSCCSVRSIQYRLARLRKIGVLHIWTKIHRKSGIKREQRYICTKWTKSKIRKQNSDG